jgi:hypothetical protein
MICWNLQGLESRSPPPLRPLIGSNQRVITIVTRLVYKLSLWRPGWYGLEHRELFTAQSLGQILGAAEWG